MSVLEKAGISNEAIKLSKTEGLIIPRRMKPFPKAFRTPGEDWLYHSADRFTPPLSNEERDRYVRDPYLFCKDLIERLSFFSKMSGRLFEAAKRIEENTDGEEALAGYLAILYLFHACGDYNYYKYDRHFEYHEYEESPVGYYHRRLKAFCFTAAQRKDVQKSGEWAEQKMLEVISSSLDDRIGMHLKYLLSRQQTRRQISKLILNFQELSTEDLLGAIEARDSSLCRAITERAGFFFKTPAEFVGECVEAIDFNVEEEIEKSKERTKKAFLEITSGLSPEEKDEFTEVVKAIHEFSLTQQKEVFIFYGITPSGNHLLEPFLIAWERTREIIGKHPELVNKKYATEAQRILSEENPVVGARGIVRKGEDLFRAGVRKLYLEELERWF